jgi:hypothetical protein
MPNGGPDNCATCGFNRINGGQWNPAGALNLGPGYCTIRGMEIMVPHFTYCKNWHTHASEPLGPVYTSMYEDGYQRVPYYRRNSPEVEVEATCYVCGDHSINGLRMTAITPALEFCGSEHYRVWWTDTMRQSLARCKKIGEQAYSDMYDASFGATGHYSDAKDAFLEAIVIAHELELLEEATALEARLQHIKEVFRKQF